MSLKGPPVIDGPGVAKKIRCWLANYPCNAEES